MAVSDPPAPESPTGATVPPSGTSAGVDQPKASSPPADTPSPGGQRRWLYRLIGLIAVLVVLFEGVPWLRTALSTVSTDDAFVNGHVTLVAPRVPGQVVRVLVDDNNRVKAGDVLVQLDKEPYQIQVSIAQAAVNSAEAELAVAEAEARAVEGQARSLRFNLDHAIEDVDNQVSLLRSRVAALETERAAVAKAQADFDRSVPLRQQGAVSAEEVDHRKQALRSAQAELDAALQGIYQIRVGLGLPPKPPIGSDLADVPPNLDQTFSTVREALARLQQTIAQLGLTPSFNKTPKEVIADFYKRDTSGDIERILADILKNVPSILQARAKVSAAQRNLDEANLSLRYTDVVADIDGVVTRREVNPGNNVLAGQSLMAIRSLTDIWVDANFKETQLADLRIGQPVDLYVDMYGKRQPFKGRVSGFTMGTGSTLALLPPENATGNFVKVVQRVPVRIDVVGYDPDTSPLFIGVSVRPYVHVRETPTGPDAGRVLQVRQSGSAAEASAPQTAR